MKKITIKFYQQLGEKPSITDKAVHSIDLLVADLGRAVHQKCFSICDEIQRDLKINHVYYCFTDIREAD